MIELQEKNYIQLELTASTLPYVCVRRPDLNSIFLQPDSNPVKCCGLSHGDTIHFLDPSTPLTVSMMSQDILVRSSDPEEPENPITSAKHTAIATVGVLDMADLDESITETPTHPRFLADVEHSARSLDTTESDIEDTFKPVAHIPKLDSQLRQPSVTTVVHGSRKRSHEDNTAAPKAKKPRSEGTEEHEVEPEVSTNAIGKFT